MKQVGVPPCPDFLSGGATSAGSSMTRATVRQSKVHSPHIRCCAQSVTHVRGFTSTSTR